MSGSTQTRLGLAAAAALALIPLATGCGGDGRYTVSGKVTYAGKLVPVGEIAFEPDASRGNRGPGSLARIKAGQYSTEPGMGVVGGAYEVRITPFDGVPAGESTDGKPLLRAPYVTKIDLPRGTASQDFDIPAGSR